MANTYILLYTVSTTNNKLEKGVRERGSKEVERGRWRERRRRIRGGGGLELRRRGREKRYREVEREGDTGRGLIGRKIEREIYV